MLQNLFDKNKYYKIYMDLITSRKSRGLNKRTFPQYTEKHHIIPVSLGGENSHENFVLLTAREHYIAHWLLTKFTRGVNWNKMCNAFFRMCNGYNQHIKRTYSSKQYARAASLYAMAQSEKYRNTPIRKRPFSDDEIEVMRASGRKTAELNKIKKNTDPDAYKRDCEYKSVRAKECGHGKWMFGRSWYTNGVADVQCTNDNIPDGFFLGRTNSHVFSQEAQEKGRKKTKTGASKSSVWIIDPITGECFPTKICAAKHYNISSVSIDKRAKKGKLIKVKLGEFYDSKHI